jgi:hypothetical protein
LDTICVMEAKSNSQPKKLMLPAKKPSTRPHFRPGVMEA